MLDKYQTCGVKPKIAWIATGLIWYFGLGLVNVAVFVLSLVVLGKGLIWISEALAVVVAPIVSILLAGLVWEKVIRKMRFIHQILLAIASLVAAYVFFTRY